MAHVQDWAVGRLACSVGVGGCFQGAVTLWKSRDPTQTRGQAPRLSSGRPWLPPALEAERLPRLACVLTGSLVRLPFPLLFPQAGIRSSGSERPRACPCLAVAAGSPPPSVLHGWWGAPTGVPGRTGCRCHRSQCIPSGPCLLLEPVLCPDSASPVPRTGSPGQGMEGRLRADLPRPARGHSHLAWTVGSRGEKLSCSEQNRHDHRAGRCWPG